MHIHNFKGYCLPENLLYGSFQIYSLEEVDRVLFSNFCDNNSVWQEFFLNVKNLLRTTPGTGVAAFEKWNPEDVELNKK